MNEFKFVTIKELAERLVDASYNKIIGFTFDEDQSISEPTGWYGVTKTYMFDGEALLFGYWGGGVLRVANVNEDAEDLEVYIEAIWSFYEAENGTGWDRSEVNENTILCVDTREFNECIR